MRKNQKRALLISLPIAAMVSGATLAVPAMAKTPSTSAKTNLLSGVTSGGLLSGVTSGGLLSGVTSGGLLSGLTGGSNGGVLSIIHL